LVRQKCGHTLHALQRRPSHEIIEADPDIHLELDEKGEIMGIEIWNAAKSGLIKQVAKAIKEITP
jgi:uncharacterized protein YuzE